MPKAIVQQIETTEKCHYGCGNIAKFINKSKRLMCKEIVSACEANKEKNSSGLKNSHSSGTRKSQSEIYASLPEEIKTKMNWNKDNFKADFSYDGKGSHKKVLINERGHICENCNLSDWLCEPIPLELEHKDGDNRNNVKDNLLLLCPNCHAKTKFYRGKNKNSGKIKVTDEQIITELKKNISIRQVLLNVGLTPKGAIYKRVYELKYKLP